MRAHANLLTLALAGGLLVACQSEPLGADPQLTARAGDAAPEAAASAAGMQKSPISGTIAGVGAEAPGRIVVTPSGRCHVWDADALTQFAGDLAGPVTFHEQQHYPCDFSDFVASGPFDGQITWNGRTGTISGQWTTNCNADASQPLGLSCDGTMNARGSGDLEGVQFHIDWGPGWYPFAYTGTAFSR